MSSANKGHRLIDIWFDQGKRRVESDEIASVGQFPPTPSPQSRIYMIDSVETYPPHCLVDQHPSHGSTWECDFWFCSERPARRQPLHRSQLHMQSGGWKGNCFRHESLARGIISSEGGNSQHLTPTLEWHQKSHKPMSKPASGRTWDAVLARTLWSRSFL